MTPTLDAIAAAIRARAPKVAERDEPYWEAAVAIVVRDGAAGPEALFIKRAKREGDPWSGQVALPGGRRDEGEHDLADTAWRETMEETGLDLRASGEIVGPLDEIRPRTPVLPPVIVRPYVATLRGPVTVVYSDEVAGHFWVPLVTLFHPANTKRTRVLTRGAFWIWRDAIHIDGHVIWGMTEVILRTFEEAIR